MLKGAFFASFAACCRQERRNIGINGSGQQNWSYSQKRDMLREMHTPKCISSLPLASCSKHMLKTIARNLATEIYKSKLHLETASLYIYRKWCRLEVVQYTIVL